MIKTAIYGAGGFGKEVASLLLKINEQNPRWNLIGFFDDGIEIGTKISRYGTVLGGIDTLNQWSDSLAVVFAIGSPKILESIVSQIYNSQISFPNIIHPDVFFADKETLKMGLGNVIVRGCSFSVDVSIGDFNQFNSISALAHDVEVGSFNVFMPLTRVSGDVHIGDLNIFGLNTLILQGLNIGDNKRTGPGSVLLTNPRKEGLYMGNPAKFTVL